MTSAKAAPANNNRRSDNGEVHTILIVDDEKRLRKALGKSLSRKNCRTLTAVSGEEALGILKKRKIDLVITDLVMPGMDGMTLVKKIRNAAEGMKIIIITAYGSPESMREAEQLGVDCYLAKPFDLSYLKSKVNEMLTAGEVSEPSRSVQRGRRKHRGAHCILFASGKTLGAAARLPQKAFQFIKPSSVIFALGRVTGAISGLAFASRRRR
ncbi:MAG: response regulator [Planctomycetota bacterium]|nr:MAG: response regulator [Planctomycetota bacterium]